MPAQKLLTDLKNRKFSPVYLLHGDEAYYIDLIADYIEKNVLSEAEKGFNQTLVYATSDLDSSLLLSNARRYPMMAEYQVILVKEAQNIAWDRAGVEEVWMNYLNQPNPSTILVLSHKNKAFDKRRKLYKAFEKHGQLLQSNKIYDNKVSGWITEYLKAAGYKIHSSAAAMIAEYLGNDLSKVVNELEKMIINVPKEREITVTEVQDNIGISKDYNVFELNKALATKDAVRVNRIINYMAANPKASPLPLVLGSLGSYFTRVLKCHYSVDKSPNGMAKTIGVSPYVVSEYITASKNYSRWKTFQVIGFIREFDLKSKGLGSIHTEAEVLLKELMFKIMH